MTRISNCLLSNGRSATRVSDVPETHAEVLIALSDKFGDSAVSARINDKTYQFNEGLENMLDAIYAGNDEVQS